MRRRIISTIAIVACAGIYAFAADERANFILTNGERKSGTVVAHGSQRENLIDGYLNLGQDNAKDLTFPVDQVALIDFTGDRRPQQNELAQLPASGHFLVLRNGQTQPGRFVNMLNGDTLVWENAGGQRQQYAIRDVSRVYLNADNARTALRDNGPRTNANTNAVGTAGTASRTIQVQATQQWTDTGIDVNQGDRVTFQASGQVVWDQRAGATASPDGSASEQRTGLPFATAPVGALIGRVGNSAPFGIGSQTQPLTMPASGRLMLGINDTVVTDNSGAFSVVVTKQ